jgi:hypothetical protein
MLYARVPIVLTPLWLSGCVGAFVPIQTVEATGISVTEAASRITVLAVGDQKNMESLGVVVGYSCKNKLWDRDATAEAALFQTKLAAAQRGASKISNLACSGESTSLGTNCWQSYSCSANALR